MSKELDNLIGQFARAIAALTRGLKAGDIPPEVWEASFRTLMSNYHAAAMMLGGGDPQNNRAHRIFLQKGIGTQGGYLRNFAQQVMDAGQWDPRWESRAVMYAESIKIPYWKAATGFANLPALPGEGTACMTNCRCGWKENQVGGGLVLWTWERASGDSCHTCVERGLKWVNLAYLNGQPLQGGDRKVL